MANLKSNTKIGGNLAAWGDTEATNIATSLLGWNNSTGALEPRLNIINGAFSSFNGLNINLASNGILYSSIDASGTATLNTFSIPSNTLVLGNGSNVLSYLSNDDIENDYVLVYNGSSPTWSSYVNKAAYLTTNVSLEVDLGNAGRISFNTGGEYNIGVNGVLAVSFGGTGTTSLTSNAVLIGNGNGAINCLSSTNNSHKILTVNNTLNPEWFSFNNNSPISITSNSSTKTHTISLSTVPVSLGGTGRTSLTANAILLGNGTGTVRQLAASSSNANKILTVHNGGGVYSPQWYTLDNSEYITITTNSSNRSTTIGFSKIVYDLEVEEPLALTTSDEDEIQTIGFSSTLNVAFGGLGLNSVEAGHILIGSGNEDAIGTLAPGANYQILHTNSSGFPEWTSTIGASGNFLTTAYISSIYTGSDIRLKENISSFTIDKNKSVIDIPLYKYDYKNGDKNKLGWIAQEIKEIFPDLVDGEVSEENPEGILGIDSTRIIFYLLAELKKYKPIWDKYLLMEEKEKEE